MAYAMLFESNDPYDSIEGRDVPAVTAGLATGALPPQRDITAAEYLSPAGRWREAENQTAGSVTERTTNLLEKKDE